MNAKYSSSVVFFSLFGLALGELVAACGSSPPSRVELPAIDGGPATSPDAGAEPSDAGLKLDAGGGTQSDAGLDAGVRPSCRSLIERCTLHSARRSGLSRQLRGCPSDPAELGENYYNLESASGTASASMKMTSASAVGTVLVTHAIAADALGGFHVVLSARVRADQIFAKPASYNGIKVMLQVAAPWGDSFPQLNFAVGSFDWVSSAKLVYIPENATALRLFVGLDGVSGSARFDEIDPERPIIVESSRGRGLHLCRHVPDRSSPSPLQFSFLQALVLHFPARRARMFGDSLLSRAH